MIPINGMKAFKMLFAVANSVGGSVTVEADVKHITIPEITATFDIEVDRNLRGQRIHLNEASRKYNVNSSTISRWIDAGHICIIERHLNTVDLDEYDVARVVGIYKAALRVTTPRRAGWLLKQALTD